MESYEDLFARYTEIKEAYKSYHSNEMQKGILLTIETDLSKLNEAILKNDNVKIKELTIKIKMFLDGFKLFS